jgi:hypothetical protein
MRNTMSQKLSVRIDAKNPNHHLWNNHGVWWIHYTIYPTPWTQKRVRRNLKTRAVEEARRLRDAALEELSRVEVG